MNWNKMVNSLILIFLSLNIGLFVFNSYKSNEKYTLSNERKEQLISILEKNNIIIKANLINHFPKDQILLEPAYINKKDITDRFFVEEEPKVYVTNRYEKYHSNSKEILFLRGENRGMVMFIGLVDNYKPASMSDSDIVESSENIVYDITGGNKNYILTSFEKRDKYYYLTFNEKFKGNIIFSNFVEIKINENGIGEAKAVRYPPEKRVETTREIFPIDEALYNLMINTYYEKPIVIKEIIIGYDFDNQDIGYQSISEAVPYYRIKLDNGDYYYINAYTNTLIKM